MEIVLAATRYDSLAASSSTFVDEFHMTKGNESLFEMAREISSYIVAHP